MEYEQFEQEKFCPAEDWGGCAEDALLDLENYPVVKMPEIDSGLLPELKLDNERPEEGSAIKDDKAAREALDEVLMSALDGELDAHKVQDLVEYFGQRTDVIAKINQRLEAEGSALRLKVGPEIERPGAEGNPDVSWRGQQYSLIDTSSRETVQRATVWRSR